MKLWIARDKDGLFLFLKKPEKSKNYKGIFEVRDLESDGYVEFMCLPLEWLPEITFENSPQEVELKLTENSKNTIMM